MREDYLKLTPDRLYTHVDERKVRTGAYDVLTPCTITICPTKEFKDGTYQWLVFGSFMRPSSKEQPSLGTVRAANLAEAKKKVQELLEKEFRHFVETRDGGSI